LKFERKTHKTKTNNNNLNMNEICVAFLKYNISGRYFDKKRIKNSIRKTVFNPSWVSGE